MKFLTLLFVLFISSISYATGSTDSEISQIECGSIDGPVSRSTPYPIHVCRLSIPSLEVEGDAGINDFYEMILSNGTREVWQPVEVKTAKIMCITAPCPYAIRNYTLRLIGYSSVVDGSLQLIVDGKQKQMKAGAQLSSPKQFENLFFLRAQQIYEARQLLSVDK